MLAAGRGQTEILRALIIAGADLTEVSLDHPVNIASFLYSLLLVDIFSFVPYIYRFSPLSHCELHTCVYVNV